MPDRDQHQPAAAVRIAQLTAAHTTELRRIERLLHDGTQNRLAAANILLGGARRALTRDPAAADALLARAQDVTEQALAELRATVRGFLPPVLADRGLPGALAALAAACPVDCRVDVDVPGRCGTAAEATAYFVVAEAIGNIARHSQAGHATVVVSRRGGLLHVVITDDGRGGARPRPGSGLDGVRRRIDAHDGTFTLASPVGGPTTLTASLPCGL